MNFSYSDSGVLALEKPLTRPAPGFRERPWVALMMLLVDALMVEAALALGLLTLQALAPWIGAASPAAGRLSLGLLVLPLAYRLAGLHPGYGLDGVERLRLRVEATLVVFGLLLAWDALAGAQRGDRAVLLWSLTYALLLPTLAEAGLRAWLVRRGWWGAPVAVLGAGETGRRMIGALRQRPELGLVPVALFDDDPAKTGQLIDGLSVAGPLQSAAWPHSSLRIGVLALPKLDGARMAELAAQLSFPHLIVVPNLFGVQSHSVAARDLGGVLGLQMQNNLLLRRNRVLKKAADVILGVPLFLVALPVIALLALWVALESPGNPFYSQKRAGQGGRIIRVWKLRSMYPDAEARLAAHLRAVPVAAAEWQRFFKLKNDPRILPRVGHILRKTSLDELPQLWNVLKGEMSLVGPRPFPDYHLANFSPSFQAMRASVPQGITGLWQVSARSDGDLAIQEALDTFYIRNWSPWLDLYILCRTLMVVLLRKGAY